jgi:hypothetical protein
MSSMTRRLSLILCLAWAATPPKLIASCPHPGTTCEQVAKADLIFLAEVLEATFAPTLDASGRPIPEGIVNYRFNVLEGVKGIEAGEFRAPFYFGGGSDLDQFTPRRRYLIFATRAETGIYRSGCGVSRETIKADGREWWPTPREDLDMCLTNG